MKHTPGPWSWDYNDDGNVIALAADGQHTDVLVCTGDGEQAWGTITSSDARLIAAAPEMAEALRFYAAVPCERTGNIHCTMLPADSGLRPCGPCRGRAALTKAGLDTELEPLCSVCRRRHGREVEHASE